ncbi:MAG: hypothetical protein MZW92_08255 [Comamonadaceae bacterium]|nr:hypothetical protein [Comamonadaceae bacterium]
MRNDPSIRLEGGRLRGGPAARMLRRIADIRLANRLWISTLASMFMVCLALWLGLQATSDTATNRHALRDAMIWLRLHHPIWPRWPGSSSVSSANRWMKPSMPPPAWRRWIIREAPSRCMAMMKSSVARAVGDHAQPLSGKCCPAQAEHRQTRYHGAHAG